jgi:hypothetical protein
MAKKSSGYNIAQNIWSFDYTDEVTDDINADLELISA